jgi:hypothetical protein
VGLKRQKSTSSQAESISAWKTVFDWPSMVAAFSVDRHVVASSSAARRNTPARSSQGQLAHSRCAAAAAAAAASTSAAAALCQSASTWAWAWGITTCPMRPVRTSFPPMISGTSIRSPAIAASRALSAERSGVPGA